MKGNEMLATLLRDRMKKEDLSTRDVGQAIGMSHTTITRILEGGVQEVETLERVSEWLGVDLVTALDERTNPTLTNKIELLVQSDPRLRQMFESAVADVESGKLSVSDLREILDFAAFRLSRK